MRIGTAEIPEARFLFTAPWEPIVVRRGDALGLRALADQFSDAIAPDLSNRIRDGRWVTILAWCLVRSHQVFHASGARSVVSRAQQHERYAWLRPLELMWIARTIALAEDWKTRSLAGQRRVRRWYKDDGKTPDRFGMSADQFRAYRQTGMYGGYRVAFRKWPGMTSQGDGWTPGPAAIRLAQRLDEKLGDARPPWPLHAGDADHEGISTRSAKLRRGEEHRWWLDHWTTFDQGARSVDRSTLPRPRNEVMVLPEADLLKPIVFGNDRRDHRSTAWRFDVAKEIANAPASTHIEVCDHLVRFFGEREPNIKLLPSFSRLADAGIAAMNLVARSLTKESHIDLVDVAALPDATLLCEELADATQAWIKSATMNLRHIEAAHRFALAITSAHPIECLGALVRYHQAYGGGLRWFVLREGKIEQRTPPLARASQYRFRLWSLCRLATQCGVLDTMPRAILDDDRAVVDGDDDDTTENDTSEVGDGRR